MTPLDVTHDPARRSWVASAAGHSEFPIQNLPFGVSSTDANSGHLVVAIGDEALDLPAALAAGWGAELPAHLQAALRASDINPLAALTPADWRAVRHALSEALSGDQWAPRLGQALRPQQTLAMQLPMTVRNYTDFYASVFHATNVGSMFRPDNPLLPNYKWVPIGYHGRASSIVIDGTPVRRPSGQLKAADAERPTFAPSRSLDYELELGLVIGGNNAIGSPVTAKDAADRLFGVVLLNDWSARDIQSWEYQPLGPFLAKNFASTISPWIVTVDALRPFRVAMPERAAEDPPVLDYLAIPDDATWALTLEVLLRTAPMRDRGDASFRVSRGDFAEAMYWSPSQLVVHHGSNGCNLLAGDILGTGTISGSTPGSRGCLLERTWRGAEPLLLPDGTQRRFLEDGDELTLSAQGERTGAVTIGFGRCAGVVLPA
ncbi:MAG: fumarylacetoacetase [Gemmatimonadales bacterium]